MVGWAKGWPMKNREDRNKLGKEQLEGKVLIVSQAIAGGMKY